MRRVLAFFAAIALLMAGATGCTALLTGGKKNDPDTQAYTEPDRTPTWISTNASRAS